MGVLIRKENWKSDIRLAVTLLLAGEAVRVPDHAFTLRFRVCNGREYYDCWRDKDGVYHNCRPNDDGSMLLCFLDNHGLGIGALHCEYYDYAPDADFADGNKLTVVPQVLPIELVSGAGDDAEQLDVEVVVSLDGVIADARAAADAANAAATVANTAATRAETAAEDAEDAAARANAEAQAVHDATSAAAAAATRANDAADAAMSLTNQAINEVKSEMDALSTRAEDVIERAENAADSAEAAASEARKVIAELGPIEDRGIILDAVVSLDNYGDVLVASGGVNQPGKGISITFQSMNGIKAVFGDGRVLESGIRSGTTFSIPNGGMLLMDAARGGMRVSDSRMSNDIVLAVASRGLMSGGVLLKLLEDYRLQGVSTFVDGNFMIGLNVRDSLTVEQISVLRNVIYSRNKALKVLGSVAEVGEVSEPSMGDARVTYYVSYAIGDERLRLTINGATGEVLDIEHYVTYNELQDAIAGVEIPELTDKDFNEICT